MPYKLSRFNVFWKENGENYVSNTFSKSIIKINNSIYDILNSENKDAWKSLSEEECAVLADEGILVDRNIDEIGMLRYSHEESKRASDEIEIVFAPTLACNFRCIYCFETARSGQVSEEMEEKIFEYICNRIKEQHCKRVRFIWFGGEPLLCCDVIERMTIKLREFCDKCDVEISFSLITNGYLLNEKNIQMLEHVKINHIQITIDGLKETHDVRRKLINGEGTFDVIMKNLKKLAGTSLDVAVRVNIDSDNEKDYKEIKELISKLNNPNLKCHPALVEKTDNQSDVQKGKCIAANVSKYYENDFIKSYYCEECNHKMTNVSCSCSAEHVDSLVIDEKGNIYKCWNSIGYEDEIYKKIYDESYVNPMITSVYLGRDPYTEAECRECAYLPICAGGCLYHWLKSGHHKCAPERFYYKEFVQKGKEE